MNKQTDKKLYLNRALDAENIILNFLKIELNMRGNSYDNLGLS